MKTFRRYLPLVCLPFCFVSFGLAQSSVDVNAGLGTAHSKSSDELINTFGDGRLFRTPSLGGVFLGFGGNVMFTEKYGLGMQASFQPNKRDYAGLKARTTFIDFNGIYRPISASRAALELQGGIGLAKVGFHFSDTFCNSFTGCSTSTEFIGSSKHFQVHGGVGVQVFLTEHIFIRPQLDLRYVPNFSQFGSNFVPGGTVWVGYSLGDRP